MSEYSIENKVVLITGAARRIGAQTVRTLHQNGANIILHYGHSRADAESLAAELNQIRSGSVHLLQADLLQIDSLNELADQAFGIYQQLDVLINNASTFYPTPLGKITEDHFNDLMGTNIKAPLFLSQACFPYLKKSNGVILNIIDIHARSPLKDYITYSCAKAANAMLVRSLAKEMGPDVRVNGVAPGAIMWPEEENELEQATMDKIINEIPLKKSGQPSDIADTLLFLIQHNYINGQIIAVDGGRQLF